jgi:hypothetical protein
MNDPKPKEYKGLPADEDIGFWVRKMKRLKNSVANKAIGVFKGRANTK